MLAEANRTQAQPFQYPLQRPFVEPDWRRLPGYRDVTTEQWESALWQRRHMVQTLKQLKEVFGAHLPDSLAASLERDHAERATMAMLVPPHMLNTMDEQDLWRDPVRRYMLCRPSTTGGPTGPVIPRPPGTRSTKPRCGRSGVRAWRWSTGVSLCSGRSGVTLAG